MASVVDHTTSSSNVPLTVYNCENFGAETVNTTVNYYNATSTSAKCKSFRLVAHPTANFVGREKLLEEIHRLLKSCSEKTSLWDRIVVIQGFGGMGKSELARKYVEIHKDDELIQNVAWIDSETKSSLENSFRSIASKFELKTENMNIESIAKLVFDHYSENSNFKSGLFIFDNVEQLQEEEAHFGILNYLPNQQTKLPLILITSRIKIWDAPKRKKNTLDISELILDDSVKLLTIGLSLNNNQKKKNDTNIQEGIRDLAKVLQGYPLGLTLAAANICCNGGASVADEIQKYIKLLDEINSGWMNHKHSKGSTGSYTLIMESVWKVTIRKIKGIGVKGECALTLLNILAFLPTDAIKKSCVDQIIKFGYPSLRDELVHGYSILEMYSLISLLHRKKDIKILVHRHVQRCTRESLDFVPDHSFLLCLGRFFCEESSLQYDNMQVHIHRMLKQRKWPGDSVLISVHFFITALYIRNDDRKELGMDLIEVIETNDPSLSHLLGDGYRMLIEMSIYILSELNDEYIGIPDTQLLEWNKKYEERFDAGLRLITNNATVDSSEMYAAVTKNIMMFLERICKGHCFLRSFRLIHKMKDQRCKASSTSSCVLT